VQLRSGQAGRTETSGQAGASRGKGLDDAAIARGMQIDEEAIGRGGVGATESKSEEHRRREQAEGVIEVEELEAPRLVDLLSYWPNCPSRAC
jgi:hypothetical protein